MLRRFVYLDTEALDQYITALEGGRTISSATRLKQSGTTAGGLGFKKTGISGERFREEEDSRTIDDTSEAKFERLIQAGNDDPEALGWVDVMQPDTDFDAIGVGPMLDWECDLYVPQIIQVMAQSGEALDAIEMMRNVLPMASRAGMDATGLPDDDELGAMAGLISSVKGKLLVVGEDDETEWQVAGQLKDVMLRDSPEGRARVVGKISKVIPQGSSKPYMNFPGMNLRSRTERRKTEREAPPVGKEDEYLMGPAIMLDILAIYR